MFTIDQIKEAHAKVKTEADFTNYVQELINLGITDCDVFVNDGHSNYIGKNNFSAQSEPEYSLIKVAEKSDLERFKYFLKSHQQGEYDYDTFCQFSAQTGVEKWTINFVNMTCTYYDKLENIMLTEDILTA